MTNLKGRGSFGFLTNKSAAERTRGETVIFDAGNDLAFTISTEIGDQRVAGMIVDATVAIDAEGLIQFLSGSIVESVATVGAVPRGNYVWQSAEEGKVEDSGSALDPINPPPAGAIGIALTGVGGAGNITLYLLSVVGAAPAPALFKGSKGARSTNQAVADSTDVALSFDQNYYDAGSYLSPGGTPTRLTPTEGGYYQAGGSIVWASAAGGLRSISVRKNGTDIFGTSEYPDAPAGPIKMTLDIPLIMSAGDYIEIVVRQESGGSLNVLQTNFFSATGWLNKIGNE